MKKLLLCLVAAASGTLVARADSFSVSTNSSGQTLCTVRNPWGIRGDSLEDSAGYATLTFAQMVANFSLGAMAT